MEGVHGSVPCRDTLDLLKGIVLLPASLIAVCILEESLEVRNIFVEILPFLTT